MTLEQAKEELIKRYKYLYENASFILAPYMHKQTKEELKEFNKKNKDDIKEPLIYLNLSIYRGIAIFFEEFLLSNIKMEESILYQIVEKNKNDKEYLKKVKKGLALVEEKNRAREYFKEELNIYEILSKVGFYIEEQSGDLKNKRNKLKVLDEYYRLFRYKNNGKIYISGRKLNLHDCNSLILPLQENKPTRNPSDIGVTVNTFIKTISNAPFYDDNLSIFTENEKQEIYLQYHDELPCDLEITCNLEEEYIKTMIDSRLTRPVSTKPCSKNFIVKEDEIFIDSNDTLYRYYQLCPHCGYIVNIPKEILSEAIKKRIEERCKQDESLFRKMYLYSELISLDQGPRRLLKRNNNR